LNQPRELRDLELDALREVANIGAGHAATALSQLTHRRVMIDVTSVKICSVAEAATSVGSRMSVVAAVLMHVLGDLTGRSLLIFEKDCALRLADLLLNRTPGLTKVFAELEQSSVKETANILTGAYLNGLSDLLGLMLIPSVPSLAIDMCAAILSTTYLSQGDESSQVIILDTRFRFDPGDEWMSGHFVLLPDPASLQVILKAIRLKSV
jgi:chemotaxis protein CheC